jgi:hypothetical protein
MSDQGNGPGSGQARPRTGVVVAVVLALWFVIALTLGILHVFEGRPVPLVAVSLALAQLVAFALSPRLRAFLAEVDVRLLLGLHAVRFVGIDLLALWKNHELPFALAVPGGVGDIAAALTVFLVAMPCARMRTRGERVAIGIWCAFGLVDILFVVGSAMRFAMVQPEALLPLTRLPLVLLPTFVVPLIVFTHVVIFWRIRRASR